MRTIRTLTKISLTYDDGSTDLMAALDEGQWASGFDFAGKATRVEPSTMWLLLVKDEYHVVPDGQRRAVVDEDGELVGHLDEHERWYKTREQAIARLESLGASMASVLVPVPVVLLYVERGD